MRLCSGASQSSFFYVKMSCVPSEVLNGLSLCVSRSAVEKSSEKVKAEKWKIAYVPSSDPS